MYCCVVNIVIVLGSPALSSTLTSRFAGETTSLGEPVQVIPLDGLYSASDSAGAIEGTWAQNARERVIKEYFFGGGKRTLSPQIQQVDFDAIIAYRYGDCKFPHQLIFGNPDLETSMSNIPACSIRLASHPRRSLIHAGTLDARRYERVDARLTRYDTRSEHHGVRLHCGRGRGAAKDKSPGPREWQARGQTACDGIMA